MWIKTGRLLKERKKGSKQMQRWKVVRYDVQQWCERKRECFDYNLKNGKERLKGHKYIEKLEKSEKGRQGEKD